MSAPKRWLEDGGGATRGERDLLRRALTQEPPPEAKDAVWSALLAQLPPIPGGSGAGGSSGGGGSSAAQGAGSAKAAAGAKAAGTAGAAAGGSSATLAGAVGGGLLKSALLGAGSAIALIASYTVVAPLVSPGQQAAPPPSAQSAPDSSASPSQPGAADAPPGAGEALAPIAPELPAPPANNDSAREPSAAPSTDPRSSAPSGAARDAKVPGAASPSSRGSAAPAMDRETRTLEESRRLTEARDALRRGDSAGALNTLSELQRAVPGGILGQEREALAIEALAKSGRSAEAQARARAFLQANPESPHAPRVAAFAR